MNRQRFRLANEYKQPARYYHATFWRISFSKTGQPLILLRNLYFVDKRDHKIPMRSKNDFVDKQGRHLVADHVWIKLTKPWLKIGAELMPGDEVFFKARVVPYKITRSDTLDKRTEIYNEACHKCQELTREWKIQTALYYVDNFDKKLAKFRKRRQKILDNMKKQQQKVPIVDYSLDYIAQIKVAKYRKLYYGYKREVYNAEKFKDHKYLNWLVWHTSQYANNLAQHRKNVLAG